MSRVSKLKESSLASSLGRPAGRLRQNMRKGKAVSFEVKIKKKIAYFLAGFRKILYLCIKDAKTDGKVANFTSVEQLEGHKEKA